MSNFARARLHELPISGKGRGSDALAVSESLGVAVVARGFEVSVFHLSEGRPLAAAGVLLPLLGSRSAEELGLLANESSGSSGGGGGSSITSVRFLGRPGASANSDLLALVVGDRLYVVELGFCAWFAAMTPEERHEQSSSPLRWRLRYSSPPLVLEDSQQQQQQQQQRVQVVGLLSHRWQNKRVAGSQAHYTVCVATAARGVFVLEYPYFESVKLQLEHGTPQWARLSTSSSSSSSNSQVRSASLGRRLVLLAGGNGEVLCWRPSAQHGPGDQELHVVVRAKSKGRQTESPLQARSLAWIVPDSVLVAFKDDGTREVYQLAEAASTSSSSSSVAADCLAVYPSMSTDAAANECFRTPTTCSISDSRRQIWSMAGVRSTADAGKPHIKLYSMLLEEERGKLSVASSLMDIVNAGILRVPGAQLLGSYLCTIQNRGSATDAKGAALKSSRVARAVERICGAPDQNGLAVVALTEQGISLASIALPCAMPSSSSSSSSKPALKASPLAAREPPPQQQPRQHQHQHQHQHQRQRQHQHQASARTSENQENQPATPNVGSKVSPRSFIRAPMATSPFAKRKPLSAATSARRSKPPAQLAAAVRDLSDRVKSAELELTRLKTDFTSFTTEINLAMGDILAALDDSVVKPRHHY